MCDRCGAAAAPDSIGGVPFAPHGWAEQANGLDLCPECVREALAIYDALGAGADAERAISDWEDANDKTCEGIRYTAVNARTVQFHPEAHGGPLDTAYLFDEFVETMGKERD